MANGNTLVFDGLTFTSDGSDSIDSFIDAYNAGSSHSKISGTPVSGYTLSKNANNVVVTQNTSSDLTDLTTSSFSGTSTGKPSGVLVTTQGLEKSILTLLIQ